MGDVGEGQRGRLGSYYRVRLIVSLVVLLALAVVCVAGIGAELHGRSETIDSLEHWRARLHEGGSDGAGDVSGSNSPAARVRRLEAELEAIPGRLFAMGVVLALSLALGLLGWRALRRG